MTSIIALLILVLFFALLLAAIHRIAIRYGVETLYFLELSAFTWLLNHREALVQAKDSAIQNEMLCTELLQYLQEQHASSLRLIPEARRRDIIRWFVGVYYTAANIWAVEQSKAALRDSEQK